MLCARSCIRCACAVLALLAVAAVARAGTVTWNGGGGDNNWSTGANWGGTAPVADDSLAFGGATRLSPSNNIAANTEFDGITFNSGAGAFTLSGNAINLGGNITNSSSNAQRIDLNMNMTGNRSISAVNTIRVYGSIGESGGVQSLTATGNWSWLELRNANTYSGGTTVNATNGTLVASVAGALGGSTYGGNVTINNGTLRANANILLKSGNSITVNNGGQFLLKSNLDNATYTPDVLLNNGAKLSADSSSQYYYQKTSGVKISSGATVTFDGGGGAITTGLGFGSSTASNVLVNASGSTVTPTINVTGGPYVRLSYGNSGLRANWNVTGGALLASASSSFGEGTSSGSLTPSKIVLNGGNLVVRAASDMIFGGSTANAIAVSVQQNAILGQERTGTTEGNGLTHTFGALSIGANTLTGRIQPVSSANGSSYVEIDTPYGYTFGAVTLTGAPTFSIDNNGTGDGTITLGAIGDGGNGYGINKSGTGRLLLTGANSYTGDTLLNAGGLALSSTGSLLFDINNSSDPFTDIGGGTTGTVSFNGAFKLDIAGVTVSSGSWTLVDLANAAETYGTNFKVAFNGGADFTQQLDGVTWTSGNWTFSETNGVLSLVPEPGTLALLAAGLIGLLAYAWRRRK